MTTAANVVIALVALLHAYFLVLEMFLWDKPFGRRVFRTTPEYAAASKTLAANQGLYNGFLAAGLLWGLSMGAAGAHIQIFFLGCVLIAGVFGAITASRKILYVQALPAAFEGRDAALSNNGLTVRVTLSGEDGEAEVVDAHPPERVPEPAEQIGRAHV